MIRRFVRTLALSRVVVSCFLFLVDVVVGGVVFWSCCGMFSLVLFFVLCCRVPLVLLDARFLDMIDLSGL